MNTVDNVADSLKFANMRYDKLKCGPGARGDPADHEEMVANEAEGGAVEEEELDEEEWGEDGLDDLFSMEE